ncbi:hypothetical protein NS220_11100 [Microbacterium testaceum]|uniref:GGDEF domain-containing protein n=1 Tax=Microbacterium testaceum TaxID=2033 RepID=A0A147EW46_MICTE|nr:hypothetical protein [Microbacterium testaceum]KTR93841.1 hypothetical protein NS220_11100 [Microbacterium testaceum]
MAVLDLVAAIAAASVAVTVLFLAHGRHGDDRGGPRAELVRYFGIAALAALACAVLNLLEEAGGGAFAAAAGNATNVLAPALAWAGMRRLNARRAIGAVSAGAGAILMLAATYVVSLDEATLLKTAAIALFSAFTAMEARRRPVDAVAGTPLLAWTMGAFAAYNAGRVVVACTAGMHSPLWERTASAEITSMVSALTIIVVAAATVQMGRQLDDDPAPGTRAHDRGALRRDAEDLLRTHAGVDVLIVRLPELDLIRTAHSSERAEQMLASLVEAIRTALPGGAAGVPARDTVFLLLPVGFVVDDVERTVSEAFAGAMPAIGYDDTPDLSFEHHRVEDVDGVSLLMESRRLRPRQGVTHGVPAAGQP